MALKNAELLSMERKLIGSFRSNTFRNAIWISGEGELDYLMSGHATELVDVISLPRIYDNTSAIKIYGVVANIREKGRYVWVYIYHAHHLWKCYSLKDAYESIEKIKQHTELEIATIRLRNKVHRKRVSASIN